MSVLRPMRRSFGISAPRMAVRPDVPWYWLWLRNALAALALVGGGLLLLGEWGGAGFSRQGEIGRELGRLEAQVREQEGEVSDLRARAAQSERQLQMERAAAADLAKQVKALTSENAALKEDVAFFRSVMSPAARREGTMSVNRFRLQPQPAPGEYHYQMLLVQSGQKVKDFNGTMQFVLDVQHEGRKLEVLVPADLARDAKDYQVNFRLFQRVEGTFKLSPGSIIKGVQVRVFENGARTPKLTQTLSIS